MWNNNSSRIRVEENVTEPEKMEQSERIRDEEETNGQLRLVLHNDCRLWISWPTVCSVAEENDNNDVDG